MIFGNGRPSVNVEGHDTFSGSVVVVVVPVVSSVDSDVVPLRRGIMYVGGRAPDNKKSTRKTTATNGEGVCKMASLVLSKLSRLRTSGTAARLWLKIVDDITRENGASDYSGLKHPNSQCVSLPTASSYIGSAMTGEELFMMFVIVFMNP
jgi:hypothetical protein